MAEQPLWEGFKAVHCAKRKGVSPHIYLPKWWLSSVKEEKPIIFMQVFVDKVIVYHPHHIPQEALQKLLDLKIKD